MTLESRRVATVEHRMRFAVASAAFAGMAGALLVGKYLEPTPAPEQPGLPAAEGSLYMNYPERVIRIENTIQELHDKGADGIWVENILDRGTHSDAEQTVYMVGVPVKNKRTFDQIVLFADQKNRTPRRLLIVRGASEQKYRAGNDKWESWVEIDKASGENYLGFGQLGDQRINSFNVQENLTEVVMDSAELMLGLSSADSPDPRLVA